MKKVMVYLLMVALLVSVSVPAAQAEIRAEVVQERDAYIIYELHPAYNIVVHGSKDGYLLTDMYGNSLSGIYDYIYIPSAALPYFEANMGTDSINDSVVLDLQGNVISEDRYGHINYLSEKWYVGLVLEPVTDETYEFFGNGVRYGIQRADLYYQGNRVASLNREKYGSPTAHGDYLYMDYNMIQERGIDGVYDLNGTFSEKEVSSFGEEYEWVLSEQCMYHIGTGQRAFTPGCTLRKEEVKDCLLYDGQGNVLDLQGNVVLFLPEKPKVIAPETLSVYADRYFIIESIKGEEYFCDLETGVLYSSEDIFSIADIENTGYVLCESSGGVLSYIDLNGNVTAENFIEGNRVFSKTGYSLFRYMKNNETGKYTIFTALEGQLKEEYDNVYIESYSSAKIVAVKKDGKWGAIDLHGNTVIDFIHKKLLICSDTSYAIGQVMDTNTLTVYQLTDADQTEADVPAEEDKEAAKLEAKAQRLEAKAARAMDKAAPLLEECAVLADKLATLEAQKATCEADLAYLDAEIAALQAEMVEQQADRMAEINALCISRDDVAAKLASCQIEIDHMKTQMENLQTEADRLIAEAEAYLAEANALRLQAQNMLPAEIVSQSEEESETWHCDACNRDNDMNFCPGCGAKKPEKLVCSGCGYEPEAHDFRFCPQCGQSFN